MSLDVRPVDRETAGLCSVHRGCSAGACPLPLAVRGVPLYAVSLSSVPVDTFLIDHLSGVRIVASLCCCSVGTGSLSACRLFSSCLSPFNATVFFYHCGAFTWSGTAMTGSRCGCPCPDGCSVLFYKQKCKRPFAPDPCLGSVRRDGCSWLLVNRSGPSCFLPPWSRNEVLGSAVGLPFAFVSSVFCEVSSIRLTWRVQHVARANQPARLCVGPLCHCVVLPR